MTERTGERFWDVTVVTHAGLPGGAPDDILLSEALYEQGASVRFAVWDDPHVDWSASSMAIIRSTWDYHQKLGAWFEWLDQAEAKTQILNSPRLVRWNVDKHYLRDLEERGVRCAPTYFVEPGGGRSLVEIAERQSWADIVVKPAVGASAVGARRFTGSDIQGSAEAHVSALLASGSALVQPYLAEVETSLERSAVFIAGQFVHAFTKPPFSKSATGTTRIASQVLADDEREFAQSVLAACTYCPLFARVDFVSSIDGPILMETEVIEPDLGLRLHEGSAELLANGCLAALDTR